MMTTISTNLALNTDMIDITIKGLSKSQAAAFAEWMDAAGEQAFGDWLDAKGYTCEIPIVVAKSLKKGAVTITMR